MIRMTEAGLTIFAKSSTIDVWLGYEYFWICKINEIRELFLFVNKVR